MFATNGVANILGLRPEHLIGKSFYYCIAEHCLKEAVRCVESAKRNDSIAYLRFWYRNPLRDDMIIPQHAMQDDVHASDEEEEEEGGVRIKREEPSNSSFKAPNLSTIPSQPLTADSNTLATLQRPQLLPQISVPSGMIDGDNNESRSSSGNSTDLDGNARDAIFDPPAHLNRSASSLTPQEDLQDGDPGIEIEAVVSCSSDGLIVIIRRARPLIPHAISSTDVPHYANGMFASPWALDPVMPPHAPSIIPPEASAPPGAEPEAASFMTAIREIAVFAWTLTGINGSLTRYAHGQPTGDALPPALPVWDPNAQVGPDADDWNGFGNSTHRMIDGGSDPYDNKKAEESGSSEDEVVWKRSVKMAEWKRPARRAHEDAFGVDGYERQGDDGRTGGTQRLKFADGH